MNSISAETQGFFDFAAWSLGADELRSLTALAADWQDALQAEAAAHAVDGEFRLFCELTARLPLVAADVEWQQQWMRAWFRLYSRGYTLDELFHLFGAASAHCAARLSGDHGPIPRVHHDLLESLRRTTQAALSCAIELGEEVRREEQGVLGELSALGYLREIAEQGRRAAVLSVALVNRDSFSNLAASDLQRLPILLADKLTRLLHHDDRVFAGREGEWLVVLPDVHSMAQPSFAAARIAQAFTESLRLFSGRALVLNARIGAALLPDHGAHAEPALQAARLARWSLAAGQADFAWYEASMSRDWQHRLQLADALRDALRQETLLLYLQPQVDLVSGRCAGAELLLRWQRPDGSWVAPPTIIELIEEHGWRSGFTDWLIRAALALAVDLAAAGIDIPLSLNLTAADLVDAELPELLAQRFATWQVDPARFTLELTESALMVDRDKGREVMQRLRQLGFRIALDDFGTGYSSLSYLVGLPINEIKIDRAFISALLDAEESLRIVRTIVDLARDLDHVPLAEGVENEAQRNCLIGLGCHLAQGFHYGRPMPVSDFLAWYHARQA